VLKVADEVKKLMDKLLILRYLWR